MLAIGTVVSALVAGLGVQQAPPVAAQNCGETSTGLVPLDELLGAKWLGHDGGLYPGSQNEPPQAHRDAADALGGGAVPLDSLGNPDPQGTIALLSIGMSNTTQEFSEFMRLAGADPQISDRVRLVDGAQGGQTAAEIAVPDARFWEVVDSRLTLAGVSREQVQFAWLKEANRQPSGDPDVHAEGLKDDLAAIARILRDRFPNLRIVYVSSRIYAGYATTSLNPEPYAYASGFAVKWLIEEQLNGATDLNFDAQRGPVVAPLLLWGPYLWADGLTPRVTNGLVWECADFAPDGTHPGPSGRYKVATMLTTLLKSDTSSRPWFMADPDATAAPSPTGGAAAPTARATSANGAPLRLRFREVTSGDEFSLVTGDQIVQRRSQTLTGDRPAWLCAAVVVDPDHEWGYRFDGGAPQLDRTPIQGRETTVRAISSDPPGWTGDPACVQVDRLVSQEPAELTPTPATSGPPTATVAPTATEIPASDTPSVTPPSGDTPTPKLANSLYLPMAVSGIR